VRGRRGGVFALVACIAAATPACGGNQSPPSTKPQYVESQWQDVFDTTPELLVVVRPQALRRDKVYGPLLGRVIDLVRQQSRTVSATHALDALEDAEEVIVGVRMDARGGDTPSEFVFVVRGVRADIDPARLVDADGRTLWSPGPSGAVRELERDGTSVPSSQRGQRGDPSDASLFELAGRTWVIATGDARLRAREAFAHPVRRPAMRVDPDALAFARVDGPALVAHARALGSTGGLAVVGHKLLYVTFELPPGVETPDVAPDVAKDAQRDIRATLAYIDEDAAALAELKMRSAVEAIGRGKTQGKQGNIGALAWLAAARVERREREGKKVLVSAPLPPALVDGLLRAGSATLDLAPPSL